MSYKIEITASTTAELAGKLLALAATMHSGQTDPVMPEVREAAKPAKARKKAEEPVAEQPALEEPVAAEPIPVDPEANEPEAEQPAAEAAPLDFDKDVAPVVLAAVDKRGKPWVQEVLSQFGAERASQIPDNQMAEFVATLKDGLA